MRLFKRILALLVFLAVIVPGVVIAGDNDYYVINYFSGVTVAADSGVSSYFIDMNIYKPDDVSYGIYFTMNANSGVSVELRYYCSNDNSTYVCPNGGLILDDFESGTTYFEITPPPARYYKFEVTETGTKSGVTLFSGSMAIK